jgi:transcriptional regulator with XRE-family HTH domain
MTDRQTLILRAKMLGAMLREARTSARMSLKEMGSLINTTSGMISSYEHGRRGISLPELELLAYHLDIPIQYFTSDSPPKSSRSIEFDPSTVISLRQRMIGALLRQRRNELEMSISAVAEATGLSSRRISTYERGERPIPLPELKTLASVLGQSVEEYFDPEGPIGEWMAGKAAFEKFMLLPAELREFLGKPGNEPYLELAKQLSEISIERLRSLADALTDLTV